MSKNYNILVIENDTRTLDLISESLEKTGISVFTATHAEVGLSQAGKIDPALILLNLATPGTKGLEICKTFQKDESLKKIPVILLTLRDGKHDPIYTKLYGIVGFLKKPFDSETLVATIKDYIPLDTLTKDKVLATAEASAAEKSADEEAWDSPPRDFVVRVENNHEEHMESSFKPTFKENDGRHITIKLPMKDDIADEELVETAEVIEGELAEGEDIETVEPLDAELAEDEQIETVDFPTDELADEELLETAAVVEGEFAENEQIETVDFPTDELADEEPLETAAVVEGEFAENEHIETVDYPTDELADVESLETAEIEDEEPAGGMGIETPESLEDEPAGEEPLETEEVDDEEFATVDDFTDEEDSQPEKEDEEPFVLERGFYTSDAGKEAQSASGEPSEAYEDVKLELTPGLSGETTEEVEEESPSQDLSDNNEVFGEKTTEAADIEDRPTEEKSHYMSPEDDDLAYNTGAETHDTGDFPKEEFAAPPSEDLAGGAESMHKEPIVMYGRKPRKKSSKLFPVLLVLLLAVAASAGYYFMKTGSFLPWESASSLKDILPSQEEEVLVPPPDTEIGDDTQAVSIAEDIGEAAQESLPEEKPDEPVMIEEQPAEPVAKTPEPVARTPEPEPKKPVQKPRAAAAKNIYYVQFGIFKGKANAISLTKTLGAKGLETVVKEGRFQSGTISYRVLLKKSYSSLESAKKESLRIKTAKDIVTTIYKGTPAE